MELSGTPPVTEMAQLQLKMPPEIAKAVVAVGKQVRTLGKDKDNAYEKFKYVSVDKFYDVIGQLMFEAGLFCVVQEPSEPEVVSRKSERGESTWLKAQYEITLYNDAGLSYGPIHRTLFVQAKGPQASGSGLSYAEKYFLRGLFKVPTGEEDADAEPQQGLPESPAKSKVPPQIAVLESAAKSGMVELEDAWKMLSRPVQEACKPHMDRIKKIAAGAKNHAVA